MIIRLHDRPDGFGYFYGDGDVASGRPPAHINLLPPKGEWDGDVPIGDVCDQWIGYVDGEEVARSTSRDEVMRGIEAKLSQL